MKVNVWKYQKPTLGFFGLQGRTDAGSYDPIGVSTAYPVSQGTGRDKNLPLLKELVEAVGYV